jgi:hypothetical protein
MAKKCKPSGTNEPLGRDYTRMRRAIADLFALVQPLVEPQETRPSKRTRTGLSVEERKARAAFQLMKDEKRREIAEFMQNYKGPLYHPVERCLWSTLCRSYECPMNLEAFGHEIGEDCLLDQKEVWKLPPIEIILKPEAPRAYMEAKAALAEAKGKNPDWSMDKDWICADKGCPNLYRHARGESCKLRMEDMLPLNAMPPAPEIARQITYALEAGWKYSGMKPYTGFYCLNNEDEC